MDMFKLNHDLAASLFLMSFLILPAMIKLAIYGMSVKNMDPYGSAFLY